jgi:type II secretory pathway component HofQ
MLPDSNQFLASLFTKTKMSEELMKRATVSLSATDTFIAVSVLCLSLFENNLITASKAVLIIITIKVQEIEMNCDVALATLSYF